MAARIGTWPAVLLAAIALYGVSDTPLQAQEAEPDRFLEECGGEGDGADAEHAEEESQLSDQCIPLADIPRRPRPVIELGAPFLGTGVLGRGIKIPGGAVWQPSILAFATWRNAVQGVTAGPGDTEFVEAVSRLDLYGNLYLTQTERVLVGFRPLDEDGQFTSTTLYQSPDDLLPNDVNATNFKVSTLFFEGDFSELFPNLDKDDSAGLDVYFSVGRQPLAFQDGGLVSEDQMDMVGLTRANMKVGSLINTRVTGVWGWGQVTRHSVEGNVTDPDASLIGLFTEIDVPSSTLELDAVYVTSSTATGDGLHFAIGDTRRIGRFNNTLRVMASFPVGEETSFNTQGVLVQNQIGWTPNHSENWWYIGGFVGFDQFRSAARGESSGGPAGRTGLLFAAPGIGRIGAPLGNQVDDAAGGSLGYQMFFDDSRQQLILEAGGRFRIKNDAMGKNLGGFLASYQAAMRRRFVLVLQGIGTYDFDLEDSNVNVAGRVELQLRL